MTVTLNGSFNVQRQQRSWLAVVSLSDVLSWGGATSLGQVNYIFTWFPVSNLLSVAFWSYKSFCASGYSFYYWHYCLHPLPRMNDITFLSPCRLASHLSFSIFSGPWTSLPQTSSYGANPVVLCGTLWKANNAYGMSLSQSTLSLLQFSTLSLSMLLLNLSTRPFVCGC